MKAGEALAVGFRYTHQAWAVVALGWVPSAVMTLLEKLLKNPSGQAPNLIGGLLAIAAYLLLGAFWCFWYAGLLGWIRDRFSETPASWPRFSENAFRLLWRLFLLLVLEMGMFVGSFLVGGVLSAVLFRLSPLVGILAIVLLISATSLLMVWVTYSGVSLAERDLGAVASIKYSMRFARSRFWGTAWLLSLTSLVWMGLFLLVLVPAFGFVVFKVGLQGAAQVFSKESLPPLLNLLLAVVNSYGWVLSTIAIYAYYLGNQPEQPAKEESS